MRITSGSLKGRVLKINKNQNLRPTSEKVREALFSSIYSILELENTEFLDLFAGTGAVGIEALSRGVGFCSFVEIEKRNVQALSDNLSNLNLNSKSEVLHASVEKSLSKLNRKYDVVFIDPPYEEHLGIKYLHNLEKYNLLKAKALVIVESAKKFELSKDVNNFEFLKEKNYGDTKLTYFLFSARNNESLV